jgi:hypothetical protein
MGLNFFLFDINPQQKNFYGTKFLANRYSPANVFFVFQHLQMSYTKGVGRRFTGQETTGIRGVDNRFREEWGLLCIRMNI